ncbi:MAG: hypothetical protein ACRDPY_44980 [Streptosporangiaceae bacterium]
MQANTTDRHSGTGSGALPDTALDRAIDLRLTALERQLAGLSGRLQLAGEQNLALETRITDLTGSVADLRDTAFVLETLAEMRLERAGFPAGLPAARRSRPRHLQALPGGAR